MRVGESKVTRFLSTPKNRSEVRLQLIVVGSFTVSMNCTCSHNIFSSQQMAILVTFQPLSLFHHDVIHIILDIRPLCFSVCNIEKLKTAWGRG